MSLILLVISLGAVLKFALPKSVVKKIFHSDKYKRWSKRLAVRLMRKLTFYRQPIGLVYFNERSPHLPSNVLIRLFKEDCLFFSKKETCKVFKSDIIIRMHSNKTEVVFREPRKFFAPVRNFLRERPSLKKFSNGQKRPSSILSHLLNDRAVVYVPNMTAVENYAVRG